MWDIRVLAASCLLALLSRVTSANPVVQSVDFSYAPDVIKPLVNYQVNYAPGHFAEMLTRLPGQTQDVSLQFELKGGVGCGAQCTRSMVCRDKSTS